MKMFIFFTAFLFVTSFSYAFDEGETVPPEIIKKLAPKNDILIVDFFASWCSSCRIELPLLNRLWDSVDRDHVDLIGIDVDHDVKTAASYQQRLQLRFRIINDPDNSIVSQFNPAGMPALYIVKGNQVVKVRFGAVKHIDEVIKSDLKQLGIL